MYGSCSMARRCRATPRPIERIVLLFDGDDADAVAGARAHWTTAKAQGYETTYWQPDEQGRWQQKG